MRDEPCSSSELTSVPESFLEIEQVLPALVNLVAPGHLTFKTNFSFNLYSFNFSNNTDSNFL